MRNLMSSISICAAIVWAISSCRPPATTSQRDNGKTQVSDQQLVIADNSLVQVGSHVTQEAAGITTVEIPVYIIAGQSNALGPAVPSSFQSLPVDSQILFSYELLRGADWEASGCSSGRCSKPLDTLNWLKPAQQNDGYVTLGKQQNRGGLEIEFGRQMVRKQAAKPGAAVDNKIAILKFAIGSTSLQSDWLNGSNGAHLKERLIDFVNSKISTLKSQGFKPVLQGMVWVQGESDRSSVDRRAENYLRNLQRFFGEVRSRCQATAMPVAIVQLNSKTGTTPEVRAAIATIRQHQASFVAEDGLATMITADDLARDPSSPVHYTYEALQAIGSRAADKIFEIDWLSSQLYKASGAYNAAMTSRSEADANTLVPEATILERIVDAPMSQVRVKVQKPTVKNTVVVTGGFIEKKNAASFISDQIQAARAANPEGRVEIVFPKATYIFDESVQDANVVLTEVSDIVLNFSDSELVLKNTRSGIRIHDGQRVALKNFKMRHDFAIAVRGTVGMAGGNPYIQLEGESKPGVEKLTRVLGSSRFGDLGLGYSPTSDGSFRPANPTTDEATIKNIYDEGLLYLRDTHRLVCPTENGSINQQKCRQAIPQPNGTAIMVITLKNVGNGITLAGKRTSDVWLENITLSNIAGCGVFGLSIGRGLYVSNLQITPDNKVNFMGAAACGLRLRNALGDVVIEKSKFSGLGDDGINLQSDIWAVPSLIRTQEKLQLRVVKRAVKRPNAYDIGNVQEKYALFDHRFRPVYVGEISDVSQFDDNEVRVTVAGDDTLTNLFRYANGRLIFANLDRSFKRGYIAENSIGNSRARGILLQGSHVGIFRNNLNNHARSAILITSDQKTFFESSGAFNILVQDNNLAGSNYWTNGGGNDHVPFFGMLTIASEISSKMGDPYADYPLFQGISLINNSIQRGGRQAIQISSAKSVVLRSGSIREFSRTGLPEFGLSLSHRGAGSVVVFKTSQETIDPASITQDATWLGVYRY